MEVQKSEKENIHVLHIKAKNAYYIGTKGVLNARSSSVVFNL
ncbi:hypothetical protein SLEP1_g14700 [Rubroshorea leprosula]|uniref:Ribosomal protein L23 n=1 Tax=Rubroshorea leprosula TaxID=152421 RepID=A0AAV5IWL3_9ROSI|nr:hypothetical protein SLEP1_g14700 [Rubroshorea leprosula]